MPMRRFFTALCTALLLTASASAGPVYVSLVLDPATAANAGGNDGTSTRSGPGTWHLYAFDDTAGSFGIASYSVTMAGITQIVNRSPSTLFDTGGGDEDAGFRLLRSPQDIAPPVGAASNPVTGAQPLAGSTSINPILGFGRAASDFATKIPGAAFSSQTSPSWGDYATDPPSVPALTGLFLAEGNYTIGQAPSITAARIQLYTNGDTFQVAEADECLGCNPPAAPPNTPPVGNDVTFPGYNNNEPGVLQTLTHQFTASDTETPAGPFTWSNLQLVSYTPNYSGVGPGPLFAATMGPTGLFSWVSEGSPRGDYVWKATVSDPGGLQDTNVTLTVNATHVPEPSTLALFGLAVVGGLGVIRRRNG